MILSDEEPLLQLLQGIAVARNRLDSAEPGVEVSHQAVLRADTTEQELGGSLGGLLAPSPP